VSPLKLNNLKSTHITFVPIVLLQEFAKFPYEQVESLTVTAVTAVTLVLTTFCAIVFKAMFFTCFSWSFSQFISSSCSLSFPNKDAIVNVVKSFDYEMAVTFGCQYLSKHLKILMFNSSLSKTLL